MVLPVVHIENWRNPADEDVAAASDDDNDAVVEDQQQIPDRMAEM